VTAEELTEPRFAQFLSDQAAHYDEHLSELEVLR
jgi:hypothetical protein